MARENFNELLAFVTVARAGSFTRAAAELQVSQSALSHTIRALETRIDLRLLTRTTRSVAPTEAGTRLLATLAPRFQEIEAALLAVTHLREHPAGSLRIGAPTHAAATILLPVLARLLPRYPDIRVAIVAPDAPCDATIRLGEHLARDTVALPIGRDLRMAVVGAPGYFARVPAPALPQQLTSHSCIALRTGAAWTFARDGYPVNVRVDAQLVCENAAQARLAALAGLGLAWVLEDVVQEDMARGTLVRVLEDWCAPFAGYHLYYPQRRPHDAAFALLLDALANDAATDRP
ncbi:LysR family transcriptional regulator [Massilia sp. S19_KUP03_FR1]|uniref:LysR family transcriptional regulator n=1 Tax=Massilia sp. S19_KUP03_FR1 TaxID=3025503 RepID=UPI002FCD94BC